MSVDGYIVYGIVSIGFADRGPGRFATGAAAVLAVAVVCAGGATPASAVRSLPRAVAPDPGYQLVQEPDEGYAPLVGLVRNAARSVRMTMYELADPDMTQALIDAHGRGVDTRILLDAAFHGHDINATAFDTLTTAGVGVKWAPSGVIYHQKTIVVDDATAAVGTGNLNAKWYPTSRDAWVLDSNPSDVAAIAATFDTDYGAGAVGHPPAATAAAHLIWSPAARAAFIGRIDAASRSLDITAEELRDRAVIAAIEHAAGRGVACRIVMTQNPQWAKALAEVSAAGCSVHLLPMTTDGLYMHEKVLLVDGNSMIIGSQNLTTASLLENRELSLDLDARTAPATLAAVAATFDSDYRQAQAAG
jgi:cardiolipin synthase A/B